MAAGHYKSVGGNIQLKYNERNVHGQCNWVCNKEKSGNLAVYTEFMIAKYGVKIFEELAIEKALHKPYRESDYREIADKYRNLVNQIKQEKGIE